MAVPSNTLQVYPQPNVREDLSNAIYNVAPYKTPLVNMAKKGKASSVYHEWDTDTLAAQDNTNAAVEGDDPSALSLSAPTRLGNYCQISRKTIQISGTSQAVVAAGGSNKMGYQLLKKSKELKRDMEAILTANIAKVSGSSSTARKSAGLPAWLGTNVIFQSSAAGANPTALDGTVARTYNGTQTPITEQNIKDMAQKVYNSTAESPEYGLVSAKNKQLISGFSGPGTRFTQVEDKTLQTAIDIYQSDFGDIKIMADIFLNNSHDTFWLQPAYLRLAYLRSFMTVPLAKTGDSDKKMLLVEYSLEMCNEAAHGAIFDTSG